MSDSNTSNECACPSGSYGKKHSTECYEAQIRQLKSMLLGAATQLTENAGLLLDHARRHHETSADARDAARYRVVRVSHLLKDVLPHELDEMVDKELARRAQKSESSLPDRILKLPQ